MGNPKEAEAAAEAYAVSTGEAPPPYYQQPGETPYDYPPRGLAPMYAAGESSSGAGSSLRFPPALNAYFSKGFSRLFHLGEKKEAPIFAGRMHSGFTKNPDLVLYDGPTDSGPILATATHDSLWKSRGSALTVAARDGVSHDVESQKIKLSSHWSFKHSTYTFEADVGVGKETRREQFEWRSSHGNEVKELDGYKWGWKLVRLSGQAVGSGGGDRATRALGSTSDGLEVVAAWAHNGSMSMSKAFKFQLMGSARSGMLGKRAATLALISAL